MYRQAFGAVGPVRGAAVPMRRVGPVAGIIVPAFTGQVAIPKGSQVKLTAMVTNVGNAAGYFKIFGFLYSTACPAGSSGYNQSGWDNVVNCITDNTKGVKFDGSWTLISPNSSASFTILSSGTPDGKVQWTGSARLWIVAAVSTSSTGQPRIYVNEYYYFQDNIANITGEPKSSISNVNITTP